MSAARWTSADLAALQSKRLDKKAKAQPKVRTNDKIDVFLILCQQEGLPVPVREFKFHPVRKWRIDYYFERGDKRLALEVEGGAWTQGRHTRGAGFVRDMEKYNAIIEAGIALIRVTPSQLMKTETVEQIKRILQC